MQQDSCIAAVAVFPSLSRRTARLLRKESLKSAPASRCDRQPGAVERETDALRSRAAEGLSQLLVFGVEDVTVEFLKSSCDGGRGERRAKQAEERSDELV